MTWSIYFKGKTEPVHVEVEADYIDDDSSNGWVKLMKQTDYDKPLTVGIFSSIEVLAIVKN